MSSSLYKDPDAAPAPAPHEDDARPQCLNQRYAIGELYSPDYCTLLHFSIDYFFFRIEFIILLRIISHDYAVYLHCF